MTFYSSTNYLSEDWSHPTVVIYLTHSENIQNASITGTIPVEAGFSRIGERVS